MKLVVEKSCLIIMAESPQDEAYLELVLGLEKIADTAKAVLGTIGKAEKAIIIKRKSETNKS